MRTDDDVDLPTFEALAHLRHFFRGNEPRSLGDLDGKTAEALAESIIMLAR